MSKSVEELLRLLPEEYRLVRRRGVWGVIYPMDKVIGSGKTPLEALLAAIKDIYGDEPRRDNAHGDGTD